ncbi:hypothetical protein [Pseudomonas agarici]
MNALIQLGYERQAPIDTATAAFLASGGQIRQCGLSETRPKPISMWSSAITRRKDGRREFFKKEGDLAQMIRDAAALVTEFGTVRRTPVEVRNRLRALGEKLTTPQVEQIAAKYRIELSDGGSIR